MSVTSKLTADKLTEMSIKTNFISTFVLTSEFAMCSSFVCALQEV